MAVLVVKISRSGDVFYYGVFASIVREQGNALSGARWIAGRLVRGYLSAGLFTIIAIVTTTPLKFPAYAFHSPIAPIDPAIALLVSMDSLLYKTPSPVIAKRRLSSVPPKTASPHGNLSEQIPRVRDYPEFSDSRRNSSGNATAILRGMEADDSARVDSSMGFRELEKVCPSKVG
jgi:hypothetical protein